MSLSMSLWIIVSGLLLAIPFGSPALAASDHGACPGSSMKATQYTPGRHTAGGRRLGANGGTAAHRTLPFGTKVVVTNPRTGASAVVTINDRGPFTRGRDIDLSAGAARAIGLRDIGMVCTQIL
jgi:rare lipoprotein A